MNKHGLVWSLRRRLDGVDDLARLDLDGLGFERDGHGVKRPLVVTHKPDGSQPVHSAILGEHPALPGEFWEIIHMVGGKYDPHHHDKTPVCLTALTPVLAFVEKSPRVVMPGEDIDLPRGTSHGFYGPCLFVSRQLDGRRIDLGDGRYDVRDDDTFVWPSEDRLHGLWAGATCSFAAWRDGGPSGRGD
jgi:hypothetical protein